jgi:signal transduction histidine kinase
LLFRSVLGAVLAVTMIRTLEVFDVETARMIESMEQQQILAAERDRIGRELHDGAIQSVYTAGLLVESAYKQAEPGSPLAARLERALTVLDGAIGDLRRNLGELRDVPLGDPFHVSLQRLAGDPRFSSFVDIAVDANADDCSGISGAQSSQLLAVVGEALSNVVRHAHARHVRISLCREEDRLRLSIRDDGVGVAGVPVTGYGLRNMRDRARLLGGQLQITGSGGKGTTVSVDVPLEGPFEGSLRGKG